MSSNNMAAEQAWNPVIYEGKQVNLERVAR